MAEEGRTARVGGLAAPEGVAGASKLPAPKLFGRLEALLPYGVRIRRAWNDGEADFFVAPLKAVEAAVLSRAHADPYVSPARPGFRAPRHQIHVWFADAGCSADPNGPLRAEAVRLMTDAELVRVSARQEALLAAQKAAEEAAASAIALEKSRTEALGERLAPMELVATDPMQALVAREQSQAMEQLVASWAGALAGEHLGAEIEALQRRSSEAAEAQDGETLCDCLAHAVAGLKAWAARHPASAAAGPEPRPALGSSTWALRPAAAAPAAASAASPQEQPLVAAALRALKAGLWSVVSTALGALDLGSGAVRARLLSTVTHLGVFLTEPSAEASIGRLRWRKITGCVRTILKSPIGRGVQGAKFGTPVHVCSVPDCMRPAVKLITEPDRFGEPGHRCNRHGGRGWCSVPGCLSKSHGKVWVADEFGEPGKRCIRHHARKCIVAGCAEQAVVRVFACDRYGPPGRRCQRHGGLFVKTCNAAGCFNRPRRYVDYADEFGPPGKRCMTHGGQRCNILGCRNISWGKVVDADEWGAAGLRCHLHGGVSCNVLGCLMRPVRKVIAQDKHGPAGPRCRQHSKDPRVHARQPVKPLQLPPPKRPSLGREAPEPAAAAALPDAAAPD